MKCFACQKMGHYVGQCPQKKKKKQQQTTTLAEVEEFTARFEREFSLFTGHVDRLEHPSSPVQRLILRGSIPC